MVAISELKRLQTEKETLLAKAELYRSSFESEYQRVRARLSWIERSASFIRKSYPFLIVVVPLGGFLLLRRRRKRRGTGAKFALAWQIGRHVWPLARALLFRKPVSE